MESPMAELPFWSVAHPVAAALLAHALETAIAAHLALHPTSRDRLPDLAGKVLELRLAPFDGHLYLCPSATSVQVLAEFSGNPDVTVGGDISAFTRLGLGGKARESLEPGELSSEGDAAVLRGFRELFAGLDRGPAPPVPPLPWQSLADSARALLLAIVNFGRDSAAQLRTDVAEFWQEETRDLPARAEYDAFTDAVQHLQEDAGRLEARLRRLETGAPSGGPKP